MVGIKNVAENYDKDLTAVVQSAKRVNKDT